MSEIIDLDKIPKVTRRGKTMRLFEEFKKISEGKALKIIPKDLGCTFEGVRFAVKFWNEKHRKKLRISKRESGRVAYVYFAQ